MNKVLFVCVAFLASLGRFLIGHPVATGGEFYLCFVCSYGFSTEVEMGVPLVLEAKPVTAHLNAA